MDSSIAQQQQLEDDGYCAYYKGNRRCLLETDDERRGWDEAFGYDCYLREMWEEQIVLDSFEPSDGPSNWHTLGDL